MTTMAFQITSLMVVFSTVYSDRSKKTPKLRVAGLCVGNSPGPVNSPHKGPVTRKMFPFDDVIMKKRRGQRTERLKKAVFINYFDKTKANPGQSSGNKMTATLSSQLYFAGSSLILKNKAQKLSHNFNLLLCPFTSECDQSFGLLSLGILFGVK